MISIPHDVDVEELRSRLEEAEETLRAIRAGEVDALVVQGPQGENVYTLQGADHAYRLLIEDMQQGAARLCDDGTVFYCNRSFAGMVHVPQQKVIGGKIADLLLPSQRPAFEAMLQQAHFQNSQGELLLDTGEGRSRAVHVALNSLKLTNEPAICMIVTDLTDQKKHEDLQNTSRRKDEFLAMLAHELRNPLAPILNAVAIIQHFVHGNKQVECANEIIERQARHLSRLVDDLLDVSRISLGKVQLQKEQVEVGLIVMRAVEICSPLIKSRNHDLTLQLRERNLMVLADQTRLAQVISNLLTNAAKYTPEGGTILIATERERDDVVIRVRDTGLGIPEDLLPHIFDLFIQGDRSLDRSEGGLGIGLTLVRRLVELHDGTVQALSNGNGRGSEFIVRLPIARRSEAISKVGDIPVNGKAKTISRRILVVDDNRDAANILNMFLKLIGHDVTVAYTAAEAIRLAGTTRFQAVLLDIGLPEISGYEVVKILKATPGYENSVLIAMTGYGQEEDKQRSRDEGFQYHFVKPVELQSLTTLLESLPPWSPTL